VDPAVQSCEVGEEATFQCLLGDIPPSLPISSLNATWTINDTSVGNYAGVKVQRGANGVSELLVTKCQAEWNSTGVVCVVTLAGRVISSSRAVLFVEQNGKGEGV
jgi:hypothetical protein